MAAAIITKIYEDKDQYDNEETYEAIDDNLRAIRLASEKMNTCWSAYLLNMRDYIKIIWEKGNSLVAPSRGSGCGFLLLNMLNITQINPLREKTKTYSFRFLNPERVSVLDIDCDIEGGKRPQVYGALQEAYGKDRVSKVLTIKTEKARSALQTAARGLGYPPEVGADLSRFIKADRGLQRTLKQTFYGDEENNIPPDKTFQDMMTNKYPDIWKVAQYIEGMVNGVGSHAGGIIFYDEPITNTTALMKTSSGDIITQYDLWRLEEVSLIKIDLLSIEALDRIRACLDLLTEYDYLDKKLSLRERYEQAIGVYNLERNAPEMWQMIHNHKVESLFQMEEQSGVKGIAVAKPTSVDDLAALNAAIRLMPPEGVKEKNFRNMIQIWARTEESCGVEALRHKNQNKVWTAEEKYELVAKVLAGESNRTTAIAAGIDKGLLYSWVRCYKMKGYQGLVAQRQGRPPKEPDMKKKIEPTELTLSEREEMIRLRAENERLRVEIAVVKKEIALREERCAAQLKAKKLRSSKSSTKKDIN